MYAIIEFGKGSIIPDAIMSIDCPNECGGIGSIVLCSPVGLWTGNTRIYSGNNIHIIHMGSITKVETRSNLLGSNEKWKTIWKAPKTFKYEDFFQLARMLKRKKSLWKKHTKGWGM
jgi:hypothetical protein